MTASLWIAGAGLTALLFAVLYGTGQKADRIIAEEELETLRARHAQCPGTVEFEMHVDAALEIAYPMPNLRRIK